MAHNTNQQPSAEDPRYGSAESGGFEQWDDVLSGGLSGAAGGAAAGATIGSVVPGVGTAIGAIAGGVIGFIGGLFEGGKKEKEQEQRERIGKLTAQALERDARRIKEVSGQRAEDVLRQSRERAGDYRRQTDWRLGDLRRRTATASAQAGRAYAGSGVQLTGSARHRIGQVGAEGALQASRERFIGGENARRTEEWARISSQRIREQGAFDAERITHPEYGQAALARLGANIQRQASSPNVLGSVAQGALTGLSLGESVVKLIPSDTGPGQLEF